MLNATTAQTIYTETLEDLKAAIEAHSSVNNFCKVFGIDRPNIVRAFSALRNPESNKTMSLGTYLKICVGLGLMDKNVLPEDSKAFDNISFLTYLQVNHTAVTNSILSIKFQ